MLLRATKNFLMIVYGIQLKNKITEDMSLLNAIISASNNFPRFNKES